MKTLLMLAGCLTLLGACGTKTVDACAGYQGSCISLQVDGPSSLGTFDALSVVVGPYPAKTAMAGSDRLFSLPVAVAVELGSSLSGQLAIGVTAIRNGSEVAQGGTTVTAKAGHQTVTVQLIGASGVLDSGVDAGSHDGATSDGGATTDMSSQRDMAPPPDFLPPVGLSLIAGQLGGQGNVDGIGGGARFRLPTSTASDGSGNLYIADRNNYTIRKMVLTSGQVTTIAGMAGAHGQTDGVGSAARFDYVNAIACDGKGTLFVGDECSIRKLDLGTHGVTTWVGSTTCGSADGTGSAAGFESIEQIAYDGNDALYVADYSNDTIRKIVISTGTVTTVAGTPGQLGTADGTGAAAKFYHPEGLALDGQGNLFVADSGNNTVRKIVLSTGVVTTPFGIPGMPNGTDGTGSAAQFYGPFGLISDGAGDLLAADGASIRKIVLGTGVVTTVAGHYPSSGDVDGVGTDAAFEDLVDISVDSQGNLFVAELNGATIRQITTSTWFVKTIAGSSDHSGGADGQGASALFTESHGLVSDGLGGLYVADTYNSAIRHVDLSRHQVTTFAGQLGGLGGSTIDGKGSGASFNTPWGIARDNAGSLFVAEWNGDVIRKVVISSAVTTTLAGTAKSAGNVDGTGAAARFSSPEGLVADTSGDLYVADNVNCLIRKVVTSTGEVSTVAGSRTSCIFPAPNGLALDGAGNLYVTDQQENLVKVVVIASGATTTIAGSGTVGSADGIGSAASFSSPGSLVFDGAGHLYVADQGNSTVRKIDLSNNQVSTVVGVANHTAVQPGPFPASLNFPTSLAFQAGDLYIFDEYSVLVAHGL